MSTSESNTDDSTEKRRRNGDAAEWAKEQVEKKAKRRRKASKPIDLEGQSTDDHNLMSSAKIEVLRFYERCLREGHEGMADALRTADKFSKQKRLKAEFERELAEDGGMQFGPNDDGIRRL
ncbi:hypothetical protein [Natrialba sp. INN-245]|uniref:hypothetical protein n=1 Tax=Natrialba sp. INN-245 TaxID=2690967 RepID=UPI001310F761|nr:hypothetical protein [Natrialba sp. INN-245]MWV40134.1 hypothetical protein [Natrialba sp. INN-245]